MSIWFSVGGTYYSGDPIVFDTPEDKIFEVSRNITIKLHHRIGKFVKLRFSFAARWIMISEITFDSGKFLYMCTTVCLSFTPRALLVPHTYMYGCTFARPRTTMDF